MGIMDDTNINEPLGTPHVVSPQKNDSEDADFDDVSGHPAHELIDALGLSSGPTGHSNTVGVETSDDADPDTVSDTGYEVIPNPNAEAVDLSELRGVAQTNEKPAPPIRISARRSAGRGEDHTDTDLDALEELVPDVKSRRRSCEHTSSNGAGAGAAKDVTAGKPVVDEEAVEVAVEEADEDTPVNRRVSACSSTFVRNLSSPAADNINQIDSMKVQGSKEFDDSRQTGANVPVAPKAEMSPLPERRESSDADDYNAEDEASSDDNSGSSTGMYEGLGDGNSDGGAGGTEETKVQEAFKNISSAQSLSTATQTHEVRMPMYLPTFKPATGCTNASDFIVRCFVARLRAGITVVKHGRSRWCKSRLRILHIHPDGRSLSWKIAEGEPTSSKRPPKLDLSSCMEVRHAWSPDPQNPMYTGTPILRQKCEAANAHKSFALIFPKRTVDITAVTADQCKVLMEGFSALCFRLQIADLAGKQGDKRGSVRGMPEEDGLSTSASATLTSSSTPRGR